MPLTRTTRALRIVRCCRMEPRLAAAKLSVEQLKSSIEAAKVRLQNGGFDSVSLPRRPLGPMPKKRRTFQGHYGKVYAVAWGGAPERLVSARFVSPRVCTQLAGGMCEGGAALTETATKSWWCTCSRVQPRREAAGVGRATKTKTAR